MKKIVMTIGVLSSLLLADGSMEAMDKYNLAYPTDVANGSSGSSGSSEETGFGLSMFDYFVDREPESPGFYVGLGGGSINLQNGFTGEEVEGTNLLFQGGYQVNPYFAVEGRYFFNTGTPDYNSGYLTPLPGFDGSLDGWGVYLKPSIPFGPMKAYALLGYGSVSSTLYADGGYADGSETGFQYGVGLNFALTNKVILFADYVILYDDVGFDEIALDERIESNVISFGITYKF